ncbi:MAG: hypothetical protein KKA65_00790 [Nanoarchaeota archaeon]|nr:hypothetical protein [Nanoarchaeota archaeon]MBU4241930.1 hypothetical protein [Nanoarchaeota archaeon]MBU4351901.1 hypothetical protein [Nanoarchaeota archaeon]MBU4456014.1 hypothetical protein [Nanoarchaeota archaeon]MCG2719955.1 hypothetical protein [Nanoarchaeota archaeon]
MLASTKKRILSYLALYALSGTCGGMCTYGVLYNFFPETKEIEYVHSRKQIQNLVKLVETPQEAFDIIDKRITFTEDHDDKNFTRDRWCSLRETYSLDTGDCDDGAIAFCAMLSDNPQYKTWFVWLMPPEDMYISGHAIAIFEDRGKYGYASFNHVSFLKNYNVFQSATYDSIDELIREFNFGSYNQYALIEFTEETLKFGRALQKSQGDLEWKLIQ